MVRKRVLIAIIALSLFVQIGCSNIDKQNGGNNSGNVSTVEQGQKEDVKVDEKGLINELNEIAKNNEKLLDTIKFVDTNISKVSKETASQMVDILEKTQKGYLTTIEDKYYKEGISEKFYKLNKSVEELNELKDIDDETIKELITETRNLGYKVETAEGMYFPIIDYSFLKKYSSYVTADMKEYIDIMSVESDKVPAKDAGLMISWDDMINRALVQEKFINEYKDSKKHNDIKELYGKYIYFAFNGLDNTPLFEYDTKTMASEAKTTYLAAIENKDNSKLLGELSGYMEALKETNYKLTDDVQKHREEAVKRLTDGE